MTIPDRHLEDLQRVRLAERHAAHGAAFALTVPARFREPLPLDDRLERWIGELTAHRTRDGLLLLGPTGTGKTHTCWTLLRRLADAGAPVQAWSVPDLLDACRPGRDSSAFDRARSAPVLLLDDVCAGKATDWTGELLYRIVNHRHDQLLTTLATTNVPASRLEDQLGQRLASRLIGMTRQVVMTGPDRRRT